MCALLLIVSLNVSEDHSNGSNYTYIIVQGLKEIGL